MSAGREKSTAAVGFSPGGRSVREDAREGPVGTAGTARPHSRRGRKASWPEGQETHERDRAILREQQEMRLQH